MVNNMDIFSYLLGKKSGGGTANLQEKSVTIDSNGTQNITPDVGYNGLSSVEVITDVPTGEEAEEKDVNFYDYDGFRVYSYTKNEFLLLESMPENPTHNGLTSQGWNWSLADAKTFVGELGILEIGQTYITDDGKTRIYINLDDYNKSPYLRVNSNGTTIINWGDGNSDTITENTSVQHNYSSGGKYVIEINNSEKFTITGSTNAYPNESDGSFLLTDGTHTTYVDNCKYLGAIEKIELGNNIGLYVNSFGYMTNLKSITIPLGVTYNSNIKLKFIFQHCYELKHITIPSDFSVAPYSLHLSNREFYECRSLTSVSLPKYTYFDIGSMASENPLLNVPVRIITQQPYNSYNNGISYIATQKLNLKKFALFYNTIIRINNSPNLEIIRVPSTATSVTSMANNYKISYIKIPSGITTIPASCFINNYSMKCYDFSTHIAVPTLSNTNAFTNIPSDCKIVVPDSLYNDWIAANNWSTYSSNIIKKTDWDSLNS